MICAPAPKAQTQATAIEKLAEAIGDVLKAATGKGARQQKAVVREVFAQPVMPDVLTPEAELKERKIRLEAYTAAATAWLDGQVKLQPAQQAALQTTLTNKIEASQQAAQKPQANNNRGHQGFNQHFPITFTDFNGAAKGLDILQHEQLLADTKLTPEQQTALAESSEERKMFYRAATQGHILNLLDAELYFTSAQRAAIADVVADKLKLDNACYALHPVNYYFQQTPITAVIAGARQADILGDAQKQRAADLAGSGRSAGDEQYISFQSNEGVDLWQDKLRDAITAQRSRVMRAVAVRVDFHRSSSEISEADAHHLQVAGKGATDTAIATWKAMSQQQLKQYERNAAQWGGNGNFSFSLAVPDVQQVDDDPIWKHTLEQLLPTASDQLTRRSNVRSAATAKFIVAMLDRELWLSKAQREILLEAVLKELPAPDTKIQNANYFLEITLLTIPMFKLSKPDLAILTDSQKTAFEAMKKPFQLQNRNVLVQMQNGGQMHLQIPK